jgi:hypothetical protein
VSTDEEMNAQTKKLKAINQELSFMVGGNKKSQFTIPEVLSLHEIKKPLQQAMLSKVKKKSRTTRRLFPLMKFRLIR